MDNARGKRRLVWWLVAVLAVLHYDFWFWSDGTLVLGFVPIGLFWQILISLGAGITWALVVRYAWPQWIEEWADGSEGAGGEE